MKSQTQQRKSSWLLKHQYKAAAAVYFEMISPIWWFVFACLQHASGVFWREWQIYGCFMLFHVVPCSWGKSFPQLTDSLKECCGISQMLSSLYVTHQSFWFWQFDADFWFERDMINVYVHSKRVPFGCSSFDFWLMDKANKNYEMYGYFYSAGIYSVLKLWRIKTILHQNWAVQSVCKCTPTICFSPGFPELKVVARVEEQGSLYHGTLPDCVVLLMDRV